MNTVSRRFLWRVALIVAPLTAFFYLVMPLEPVERPLLIGRSRLTCGDVALTQRFTGTLEPYIVSLYYRPNSDARWLEYYVDHEGLFWRGTLRSAIGADACQLIYYGAEVGSFSCSDLRLQTKNGRKLAPKRVVTDPFALQHDEGSPMDVGATSDALLGGNAQSSP